MASPLQSVSRSSDFWFDDGNLILQVEATQFRIHGGLICASSSVFRDMHAVSQPEQNDSVDGCPVVLLQGDTAADWNHLLEYIYFPAKISQEEEQFPFPRVASMLRLGSKYDFAEIRSLALRTIYTQVPVDSLETWNNVLAPASSRLCFWSKDTGLVTSVTGCIPGDWLDGNHFDLLNLAIEQGLQRLLPLAYYLCIHEYSLKEILSGIERPDGTVSTVHPGAISTLLLGRQELHVDYSMMLMSWLTVGNVPVPSCSQGLSTPTGNPEWDSMTPCQQSRINGLVQIATSHPDNVGALDFLNHNCYWNPGFCGECVEEISRISEIQRSRIYQDLPSYFNLPKWSALKDRE